MTKPLIAQLVFTITLFTRAMSSYADYTPQTLACYQSINLSVIESIRLCKLPAQQGDAHSQFKLAESYLRRNTHGDDLSDSLHWLLKAAEQSHPEAQFNLAVAYQYGKGTNANSEMAAQWYKKSALLGFAKAQRNLAHMYESGTGLEQDFNKAFFWFEKAAFQGLGAGQLKTGLMLLNGKGTTANEVDALTWITRAARAGNTDAQFSLATILKPTSPNEAISLYRKAASQNHTLAMYNLAIHYASPGAEQDFESALSFADKAIRAGHIESVRLKAAIGKAAQEIVIQNSEPVKTNNTARPLGQYSLQLVFSSTLTGAQSFIAKHKLSSAARIYKSNIDENEKFIVLTGNFENSLAAKEALIHLDSALRATKPFPKSTQSLAAEGYRATN